MICGNLNKLKTVLDRCRNERKKIVFTNGCFDLLHTGHVRYLKAAKKLGDVLIVGVNSDASVKTLKGKHHPIVPEEERAEIVDALKPVDYVVLFHESNPEALIQLVKPDIHVKGGDYTMADIPEAPLVKSLGGKTVILKEVEGKSTSNIIQQILQSYITDEGEAVRHNL